MPFEGAHANDVGLTNALLSHANLNTFLRPTRVENLRVLTTGPLPPNPAELLSSKRMQSLIEELKENFDLVIFDSPPVISVADSAIIASRMDGTILVSRSGFVPRHLCLQAKNALESVHAKVIGCVLNGVETQHQPYYYYEYYRQYGRYEEEETGQPSKERKVSPPDFTPETIERLRALREPLLILLANGWARLKELLKWERLNREETKSSVGRQ
jgi:Mrp family chromosome partitioning ATPase